ncbi:hypothetical protein NONI108955_20675 [Nocardia ninae]|uniref:Uncharacterized protein n=1 Tax=Nocardia ninae NBRC 108245 TaxID=1210091 RepID=A0A511M9Q8_9NOCA|nr:hypothetical protein [Nocardia ninae]GEM37370.1 hypothetical protein NN4_18890 [Nocardia ninae NBRC 108245]
MDEPGSVPKDQAVMKWLEDQHRSLEERLRHVLDIEPGLAEVFERAGRSSGDEPVMGL